MVVGGLAFALFPLSVTASHTVMIEPYLTLFCLLALRLAFDRLDLASRRRLLCAGIMLGAAGTIKIWAVLPAAALLLVLVVRSRQSLRPVIAGMVAGGVVPLAPFLFAAPGSFVHDVLFAQEGRLSLTSLGSQLGTKLLEVTGLSAFGSLTPPATVGIVVAIAAVLVIGYVFYVGRLAIGDFDRVVLCSTAIVVVGMLSTTNFFLHYAYFTAAFISLLIGDVFGLAWSTVARRRARHASDSRRSLGPIIVAVSLVIGLVSTGALVHADASFAQSYLSLAEDNGATLAAVIPAGSCVVSDDVSFLVDSNRLTATGPGCPTMIDYYGGWLVENPSGPPPIDGPYSSSLVATWAQLFTRADYLVFISPDTDAWPRTSLTIPLYDQYRLVYAAAGSFVYCHVNRSEASASASRLALDAGVVAQGRRDFSLAVADYDQALVEEPCSAQPLFDLGTVQQLLGDNQAAIALYEEVLAINPGDLPASAMLGYIRSLPTRSFR